MQGFALIMNGTHSKKTIVLVRLVDILNKHCSLCWLGCFHQYFVSDVRMVHGRNMQCFYEVSYIDCMQSQWSCHTNLSFYLTHDISIMYLLKGERTRKMMWKWRNIGIWLIMSWSRGPPHSNISLWHLAALASDQIYRNCSEVQPKET